MDKYEQFETGDEEKKDKKSKTDSSKKYKIIIAILLLINLFILGILFYSKSSNSEDSVTELGKDSLRFL